MLAKKDPIEQNWRNRDLFEHKTKIRTYLKKLDKNWDQKCILTYKKYQNNIIWKIYAFCNNVENNWVGIVKYDNNVLIFQIFNYSFY